MAGHPGGWIGRVIRVMYTGSCIALMRLAAPLFLMRIEGEAQMSQLIEEAGVCSGVQMQIQCC